MISSTQRASIILNGPELLSYEADLDYIVGADSTYGFSYAALTNLSITDFLYEPLTLLQVNLNERADATTSIGGCINAICVALQLQIPIALSDGGIERVHLNPVHCQAPDMVVAPTYSHRCSIHNKFFFVNETNLQTTLQSLKLYFSSGAFLSTPLNFRCSAVRAVSLAYIKGCRIINIYGMSPSTSFYWQGRASTFLLKAKNSLWQEMFAQWIALEDEAPLQTHGGVFNMSFEKSISYSFFMYIALLEKFHRAWHTERLSLNVFSNDPLVAAAASATRTMHLVK